MRKWAGKLEGVTTRSDSKGEGRLRGRVRLEESVCLNTGLPGVVVHGSWVYSEARVRLNYNSQEHKGLPASTRVRRQKGTAPVLILEPVSEAKECRAWNARTVQA